MVVKEGVSLCYQGICTKHGFGLFTLFCCSILADLELPTVVEMELPADPPQASAPIPHTTSTTTTTTTATATTTTTSDSNNPSATQAVGEGGEVETVPPEAQQQPRPRNPVTVGEADVAAGGEGGVAVGEKREEGDGAESEGATGGAVFEASSPDSESKSVIEGWCLLALFQLVLKLCR